MTAHKKSRRDFDQSRSGKSPAETKFTRRIDTRQQRRGLQHVSDVIKRLIRLYGLEERNGS